MGKEETGRQADRQRERKRKTERYGKAQKAKLKVSA